MKIVAGVALLLIGSLAFLLLFPAATTTKTVIESTFALGPSEKYEPPKNGTTYHTRIISKSSLTGELIVENGSINFTANGYNTQHLKNISINQNYSFVINPADDLYWFIFENSGSTAQSSVQFILKETWTNIYSLVFAIVILLACVFGGIALVILGFLQRKQRRRGSSVLREYPEMQQSYS
jgi:hypothetical protein